MKRVYFDVDTQIHRVDMVSHLSKSQVTDPYHCETQNQFCENPSVLSASEF